MVHPYLRGAYAALPRQQLIFPGSSPHTWGIHRTRSAIVIDFRFIPTYVGHIMSLFSSRESRAVHPHIRGAYRALGGATTPTRGSSPHTWGIHWLPANHANPRRFIPTYVGHTRPVVAGSRPRRFIPTYVGHTDLKRWFHGLSAVHPHIRGAYGGARLDAAGVYGFIPTYVGHTCRMQRSQRQASVHPHIRGAYRLNQRRN